MSLRERILSNIATYSLVYLAMIELRSGLVAHLIYPYVPWR